jgi:2-polyprenyl-3-methyl-5-hydroxy-6-metoxy-1,4-benzoquinol methylase
VDFEKMAIWRRYSRKYFEKEYAPSSDPAYFQSSIKRSRYKRIIEALPDRRYHRALEIGCATGDFTAMLAPSCEELLAVDISEKAVSMARKRLTNFPHVFVEQRTLPEETPEGPFDLVIASEVLYFLPTNVMLVALQRLEEVLSPGGVLLAIHSRRVFGLRKVVTKIRPLFLRHWILKARPQGDEVHNLLLKHTRLANMVSLVEPEYRLDLFENKLEGSYKMVRDSQHSGMK